MGWYRGMFGRKGAEGGGGKDSSGTKGLGPPRGTEVDSCPAGVEP